MSFIISKEEKTVQELVKLVIRAFYDPVHIVIIDALLREKEKSKSDIELAEKLNLELKVVTKALQELANDLLVENSVTSEKSTKTGKLQTITTWFLFFPTFVNAVRVKIKKFEIHIKENLQKQIEYICSNQSCEAIYEYYEVVNLTSFICQMCKNGEINEIISQKSHLNIEEFNKRIQPINDLLKQIEKIVFIGDRLMSEEEYEKRKLEQQAQEEIEEKVNLHEAPRPVDFSNIEITFDESIEEEVMKVEEYPFFLREKIYKS
jgi:transcription initiation factor TFIIE subunit alpha